MAWLLEGIAGFGLHRSVVSLGQTVDHRRSESHAIAQNCIDRL